MEKPFTPLEALEALDRESLLVVVTPWTGRAATSEAAWEFATNSSAPAYPCGLVIGAEVVLALVRPDWVGEGLEWAEERVMALLPEFVWAQGRPLRESRGAVFQLPIVGLLDRGPALKYCAWTCLEELCEQAEDLHRLGLQRELEELLGLRVTAVALRVATPLPVSDPEGLENFVQRAWEAAHWVADRVRARSPEEASDE